VDGIVTHCECLEIRENLVNDVIFCTFAACSFSRMLLNVVFAFRVLNTVVSMLTIVVHIVTADCGLNV